MRKCQRLAVHLRLVFIVGEADTSLTSADDIPVWWIGLSLAVLLVSIVIGAFVLTTFNLTANDWTLPAFVGSLSGGVTLLLLAPVLRARRRGPVARPPPESKS